MNEITVNSAVVLSQLKPLDASEFFEVINKQRDVLSKWTPFFGSLVDQSEVERYISSYMNQDDLSSIMYTIRIYDEFAGIAGFRDIDDRNHRLALSYWLSIDFQKQGHMTQCIYKLCELAYQTLDINRVEIRCVSLNEPSKGIPKRLGFHLDGIERQSFFLPSKGYLDVEIYSLLKDEFYEKEDSFKHC